MKLGSFEWDLFGFLHEEIRNTRFLLTGMSFFLLFITYISQVYLATIGIVLSEALQSLTTALIQAEISFCLMALTFYFKDRASQDTITINKESVE
jgi:hypothetical protein